MQSSCMQVKSVRVSKQRKTPNMLQGFELSQAQTEKIRPSDREMRGDVFSKALFRGAGAPAPSCTGATGFF